MASQYSASSVGGEVAVLPAANTTLYGPPPPQSGSRGYDRMKGLEAAILLRRSEIDALRQRREELQQLAIARSSTTAGVTGGKKVKKAKKRVNADGQVVDDEEDRDDPTNIPIVQQCSGNGFSMFCVPPERFGDTCIEMEVATDSLSRHTAILQKAIAELDLQSRMYAKDQEQLTEQIGLMCELTGMPIAAASTRTGSTTNAHLRRQQEDAKYSMAPGHKMLRGLERGECPNDLKAKNDTLRKYVQTLTRETREAKALMLKKERAIKDMAAQLAAKKKVEEETLSLYNSIRVEDRTVRERKQALRALLEEHERVNYYIDGAVSQAAASSVSAMDKDLAMIRDRISACVEDERRLQDRIGKAQEYRITILTRRIDVILQCVKTHRLDADVEALIAATLELQRQQELGNQDMLKAFAAANQKAIGGGGASNTARSVVAATPSPTSPPSPGAGKPRVLRGATVGSSSSVYSTRSGATSLTKGTTASGSSAAVRTTGDGRPIVNSGQLIIAPASHKQAAHDIASLRREELYDIDSIIPPNETIHPAVYSIFVSEKEQLARKAVTTKLLAEEKMAAVIAMNAKSEALANAHAATDQQLHRRERTVKGVESRRKEELLEEVTTNRTLLQQAMHENVTLSKAVTQNRPIAEAAREEQARRALRKSTLGGGGYGSNSTPSNTPGAQSLNPPPFGGSSFGGL